MSYFRNGTKVSREEFLSNAKGFDFTARFPCLGSFSAHISPIDGSYIGNSKQLADHCRVHNVVQVGDDLENKRKGNDYD